MISCLQFYVESSNVTNVYRILPAMNIYTIYFLNASEVAEQGVCVICNVLEEKLKVRPDLRQKGAQTLDAVEGDV